MSGRGLREQKKEKTKLAIQDAALRLFDQYEYRDVSIEQITQAAGVSRATFFRYFTNKADVVLFDVTDRLLTDALSRLPADDNPVRAFRKAIQTVDDGQAVPQRDADRQREYLMRTVAELRAKVPHHILAALPLLTAAFAKRHGRPTDDLEVRTVAGAIIGVTVATWTAVTDDLSEGFAERYVAHIDRALHKLENGVTLTGPHDTTERRQPQEGDF